MRDEPKKKKRNLKKVRKPKINMATKPKATTTKTTLVSKKTLVERIITSISKKDKETIISKFLEEINKALINGEEIRLPGHFTFKTVITKPRVAMNLQTKQKMTIPAKQVP